MLRVIKGRVVLNVHNAQIRNGYQPSAGFACSAFYLFHRVRLFWPFNFLIVRLRFIANITWRIRHFVNGRSTHLANMKIKI
jgi:hypothetical protein